MNSIHGIQSDLEGSYLTRAVGKGIFQSSAISLVLSLTVINKILPMLTKNGVMVGANVDNLLLLASGMAIKYRLEKNPKRS